MNSTVDATYIYSEFGTPASQPQEIREKRREDKHLMDDVFLRPNDDPPWTIPRQRRIPNPESNPPRRRRVLMVVGQTCIVIENEEETNEWQ